MNTVVLYAENLQRYVLSLAYYMFLSGPHLKCLQEENSELILQDPDRKPEMQLAAVTTVPFKTTPKTLSYLHCHLGILLSVMFSQDVRN